MLGRKKSIVLQNCDDRFVNGEWLKSWMHTTDDCYIQHRTRAYNVWMSINSRENGSVNGFSSFSEFAEWCQTQYGYRNVDPSGRFWQIDKDLRISGNMTYCKEACMFVPVDVNSLLNHYHRPGEVFIGVRFDSESNIRTTKFVAACKGSTPVTKRFNDPLDAHMWWIGQKLSIVEKLIDKYRDHEVLCESLMKIQGVYQEHLENRNPVTS